MPKPLLRVCDNQFIDLNFYIHENLNTRMYTHNLYIMTEEAIHIQICNVQIAQLKCS
jgi:hypothetical protein